MMDIVLECRNKAREIEVLGIRNWSYYYGKDKKKKAYTQLGLSEPRHCTQG